MKMRTSRKKIVIIIIVLLLATVLLTTCDGQFGSEGVLKANNKIAPVVTITSLADGDPYAPTVTVTGTITDTAETAGTSHPRCRYSDTNPSAS